jgi:hypothetical protein
MVKLLSALLSEFGLLGNHVLLTALCQSGLLGTRERKSSGGGWVGKHKTDILIINWQHANVW